MPFYVGACEQNPRFSDAVDIWTCLQILFGGNNWLVNCKQLLENMCISYMPGFVWSIQILHTAAIALVSAFQIPCVHTGQMVLSWAPYADAALHFQPMLDIETIKKSVKDFATASQCSWSLSCVCGSFTYPPFLRWLLCH